MTSISRSEIEARVDKVIAELARVPQDQITGRDNLRKMYKIGDEGGPSLTNLADKLAAEFSVSTEFTRSELSMVHEAMASSLDVDDVCEAMIEIFEANNVEVTRD